MVYAAGVPLDFLVVVVDQQNALGAAVEASIVAVALVYAWHSVAPCTRLFVVHSCSFISQSYREKRFFLLFQYHILVSHMKIEIVNKRS